MIKIFIGPSATGKTGATLQRIVHNPGGRYANPTFVILPDRYQLSQFRHRLAGAGGYPMIKYIYRAELFH